ncbi:IS3 family transposase [Streptomyces sp. NRRL F-5650]|uniref:IS3 family transposase n=1 Tax=Streptomyces sp. NRRL F-5650 TaxID=1463868 RepID=UPI000B133C0B
MTALVDEHPHLGVEPVLRELNIPTATYCRWRQAENEPCQRRCQDAELTDRFRHIHEESGGTYGSPRVHAVLKGNGVHVGRKRVERLMREADIAGISPRHGRSFTYSLKISSPICPRVHNCPGSPRSEGLWSRTACRTAACSASVRT